MDRPAFERFYETTLRGRLQEMEGLRREVRLQAIKTLAAGLAGGGVVGGAWTIIFGFHDVAFIVGAVLACVVASAFWFRPAWNGYRRRFKSEIIAEVVRFISPKLQFEPDSMIDRDTYLQCGIFRHSVDKYDGEDYVSGTVGATALRFSEVHAQYKTESTDSKGNTRTQWHTIFKGLLFQGDFNKHFDAQTFVLTDVAEKWLGTFVGQSLQGKHGDAELVKLEDPLFEKEFVVHGTDQVEARYILTPSLMTRVVDFRKKAKRDVQLSFIDSSVFVAIPYRENLFEPSLFRSGVSRKQIASYYDALSLTISIVEELNLNTRIWSKA